MAPIYLSSLFSVKLFISLLLSLPRSFLKEKNADKKSAEALGESYLFADSQPLNYLAIPLHFLHFEVVEKVPPLANQFQQTPAGMVVLHMRFKVLRQISDALAQDSDLNFGRPRVGGMDLKTLDNFLFLFCY
jgi:hypothetical protein